MREAITWSVFFVSFLCFGCSNDISKQKETESSYGNVCIQIECPGDASYYLIDLASNGQGSLAFCFERADSMELKGGKTDSILRTATFHISRVEMQIVDTLISSMPTRIDSRRPRDTFSYILKIDGKTRIASSYDVECVYKLLKVLVPYFPEDGRTYDFCEFFKVFKTIKIE